MKPIIRFSITTILVFAAVLFAPAQSVWSADPIRDAAGYITGDDMLTTISELASQTYEGRLTGQPGQHRAAQFMADKFAEYGLEPIGDGGTYLQKFTTPTNIITGDPVFELMIGDKVIQYQLGSQYLFRGETGAGDITAQVCFAGYGITDEYLGYDDYKGIDATGKWALVLRGWHPAYPQTSFDWAYTGWKARNAKAHGAVGMILMGARADGTVETPIGSYLYGLPVEDMYPDFPMVHAGMDFSMDVFQTLGWYLPGIVSEINEGKVDKINSFDLPSNIQVHVKVECEFNPEGETMNIIGVIPGVNPKLAEHAVIVCAHHDHVGHQDGVYFPGSDDNASGTAALVAIAKAAASNAPEAGRTIILVSFTGEEEGLLGSKYFVENPPWPLDKIDYVINLDMVGQGSTLTLWGGTDFKDMRNLFGDLGEEFGVVVEMRPPYPVSDHGPFVDKGIKAVMLLGGGQRDYDTAHKPYIFAPEMINKAFMEKVARMAFIATYELAE